MGLQCKRRAQGWFTPESGSKGWRPHVASWGGLALGQFSDPLMVAALLLADCNAGFSSQAAFISLHGAVKVSSPISLKIPELVWGRAHDVLPCSAPQRVPAWRAAWEPGASPALAFSEPVTVLGEVG